MLGANIIWGLMSPVAKLVLSSGIIAPLVLVDFRVAGAALLFWILSAFFPKEHVPPRDLLLLAGAAMIGVLFNQGCFIIGVSFTSPGEASLITTTMPMWVMILAWFILHEPITGKKIGGILLGAAGALILVFGNLHSASRGKSSRFRRFHSACRPVQLCAIPHTLPQFHPQIFACDIDEMDVSRCHYRCVAFNLSVACID